MKKIIALNKVHLEELIYTEINKHGHDCDLNHIDVSRVTDMEHLFTESKFTGDISTWDVSKVQNMLGMFHNSQFNGNISEWNLSNVMNMAYLFTESKFNQDISRWNVSKVKNILHAFDNCPVPRPYWAIDDEVERKMMIQMVIEKNKLKQNLDKIIPIHDHETMKIKL